MLKVYRIKALKYVVVTLLAVVFIGFVDENSVWNHLRNKHQISLLQDEIEQYNQRYRHDQEQIHLLDSDPKAMEKIARERYFMKTDDEDIYVLSDDAPATNILNDETVE
ncbi:MAG: septum formation initiator family protein [Prevotella sp.]|nr:septum formation initiator family protein [Prevotella sp.]